jgi:Uma2 family endonuclease
MDAVLTPTRMTAEEYLVWESAQPEKHEFIAGEVFARTGARLNHNLIAGNAFLFLKQALRGLPCGVFMSDVKVQVRAASAYFYPDVVVTCEPSDLADGTALTVHQPWLIVEVLSDSTAAYDRGKKFEHYRQIASLTHYLLVDSTRVHAELFRKNAEGLWVLHPLGAADTLRIEQPHLFDWLVGSLFEGVPFEPVAPGIDAA